jgi:hypothetical protein
LFGGDCGGKAGRSATNDEDVGAMLRDRQSSAFRKLGRDLPTGAAMDIGCKGDGGGDPPLVIFRTDAGA